jgi:formylglycine-generating enzyme required for sulfatase activity
MPPDEIRWLNFGDARRHGIDVVAYESSAVPELSQKAPTSPVATEKSAFERRANMPLSAAELALLKPHDSFRECGNCPEMVVVPAGSFLMGSPESEAGHYPEEGPQHTVMFTRPFAVGKFTVTFAEWDACVAGGGCGGYRPDDEGWGRDDRPVINVSWNDANAYVAWLSKTTGKVYRLLTEAELEYVTRAGTTTPFWWGSSITPEQANYDGSFRPYTGGGRKGEDRQKTVLVQSFKPNPWGLYQVHGNVCSWVEDCWHDTYTGAPVDGSAWISKQCIPRVLRGGSWLLGPEPLRAASRRGSQPDNLYVYVGFRLARTLLPPVP